MEMKINKIVLLKVIALLLCVYIAIVPFYQPKKVQASPVLACAAVFAGFISGMAALGYIHYSSLTSEQMEELNNKATANLKEAYPNATDYDNQVNIIYNLENDLLAGKEVDWSKYSGKAIYAISKAVIDVLYPQNYTVSSNQTFVAGFGDISVSFFNYTDEKVPITGYNAKQAMPSQVHDIYFTDTAIMASGKWGNYADGSFVFSVYEGSRLLGKVNINRDQSKLPSGYHIFIHRPGAGGSQQSYAHYVAAAIGIPEYSKNNAVFVPNITAKTANKIKLPTRLPPSVINNYNTYINGDSENLTINPTADELPQLPDNYNPVTDDPPDLVGYQDVTPDQEPTDTPDPTPTPSTPEYDGSSWIKPIGDFFAGLLSFLKDALIPTQTVDFSPLQNMGTDFGKKFPFSLPGDIGKLFGVLQAEPRRPEFQMTFDLSKVGVPGDPIVWDLKFEQWDGAAAIVKTALYIGFLIGLVFISKNFMKN